MLAAVGDYFVAFKLKVVEGSYLLVYLVVVKSEVNRYQLVVPSFDRVVIHLGQEKRFVITVEKESEADVYIEEVWLNKRKLDRLWIMDDEIMLGGKLNFVLTNE